MAHRIPEQNDKFICLIFSAKWDIKIYSMSKSTMNDGLKQDIPDFHKKYIKSNVLIMGENKSLGTAKYIHGGEFGKGQWTFYGGRP